MSNTWPFSESEKVLLKTFSSGIPVSARGLQYFTILISMTSGQSMTRDLSTSFDKATRLNAQDSSLNDISVPQRENLYL